MTGSSERSGGLEDPSDQDRLQQALDQVRRLQMVIDGCAAGSWEWNVRTGQMRVNERWAGIVGHTLAELQPVSAETFERLVHPDDLPRSDRLLQAHLHGHSDAYECLLRMRHRDGRWVWVQNRGRVYERDAQGQPVWMAGAHTDVSDLQQARAEARLAEGKFAGAFSSAALGMALVSLEGRWLDVNDALCRLLGYTRAELMQVDFRHLAHPDDTEGELEHVPGLLQGLHAHYHLEKRYLRRDGSIVWARLSVSLVRDERDEPLYFVAHIQDVTGERTSEQRVLDAEQRSRITLDAVADLVLSVDLQGRIEHANAAAGRALGGADDCPLQGRAISEVLKLTTEYAPHSLLDASVLLDPHSNAVDLHSDLLLVQGEQRVPVDLSQAWLHDDAGRLSGGVWVIRDVTQLRARQREAQQLAELDPLTNLVNRRGFEAHLQQAIAHLERTGQAASLMFIDLDQFKPVNDTWGHLAGDAVLWAVANVLRQGVRDSDVVARLGGDEFAVILVGCSLKRARRIGDDLLQTIAGLGIPWEQQRIGIGVSIGIAAIRPGMQVADAVAAADTQCYLAKAAGRNNVQSEKGDGGS